VYLPQPADNNSFVLTTNITEIEMAAQTVTTAKPASPAPAKEAKEKKPSKPLYARLEDQITRAMVGRKITHEEATKLETLVSTLKALLPQPE
jgi:hypothetical protein